MGMSHIVDMLVSDVPDNIKFCSQYFWSLLMFARIGPQQCKHLFKLGSFEACFQFLTGVPIAESMEEDDKNKLKKWTGSQTRELGDLHALLAYLILSCDTKPFMSHSSEEQCLSSSNTFSLNELEKMPTQVSNLLYGPLASLYISETISACREVNSSLSLIIEMLVQVSYCCKSFSILVLEELMKQYNSVTSSELKNLSTLLVELLCISDPLQNDRLKFVIEGVDGLLDLVQKNQNSDSCRSYQAVKCLVTASSKCPAVKDHLILEPTKWQWAVNWLKSKMSESYWSPKAETTSNEDSSSRVFQRTTSAQVTLDEANAMLAEFDTETAMDT